MQDKICMICLGYVGLPMAVAFAEKMPVVGFDIDQERIKELEVGHDRTLEVTDEELAAVKSNMRYAASINDAKDCNIYIITVPTPIDSSNRRI